MQADPGALPEMTAEPSKPGQTISVAVAIDENFLLPLLVTLRSAARHLAAGWNLEVFVFGYEIAPQGRTRLEAGVRGLPVRVHWRTLDLSGVEKYWPGINRPRDITCYYRLFLGDALPESLDRVLFLDADLLVEGDLATLWNLPFEGALVQAVPDAYARDIIPVLQRIEFSEGIRFSRDTPYFNAGVLLMDLAGWRAEKIGQRAGAFLWKYGEQLRGRDQDALNCALAGRWKILPPSWNFQEFANRFDSWHVHGATPAQIQDALRNPAIIHFIGWKPWTRTWRPHRSDRWWAEARLAGVEEVPRIRHVAVWDALFWGPHSRLEWLRRRADRAGFWRLMLSRPWTLLTYPLWRLANATLKS